VQWHTPNAQISILKSGEPPVTVSGAIHKGDPTIMPNSSVLAVCAATCFETPKSAYLPQTRVHHEWSDQNVTWGQAIKRPTYQFDLTGLGDQDIVRLNIPMNDALLLMEIHQGPVVITTRVSSRDQTPVGKSYFSGKSDHALMNA